MKRKKQSAKKRIILWELRLDGKVDSRHHTEKAAIKYATSLCESLAYQDDPWFPKVEIIPLSIDDD